MMLVMLAGSAFTSKRLPTDAHDAAHDAGIWFQCLPSDAHDAGRSCLDSKRFAHDARDAGPLVFHVQTTPS